MVSTSRPEAAVARDLKAHGLVVHWAPSIDAAAGLLSSARKKTVIVTERALTDGNWRDLVDRVRCKGILSPIVLLTPASTAELWWDALECGVDEILAAPLKAFPLCRLLEAHFA